jgi:hypothetical protein
VIFERGDGLVRQGVDGVLAYQRLDVHHIRVVTILGGGGSPQRPAVIFDLHKPLSQVLERSLRGSHEAFPWFIMVPHGSGVSGIGGLADGITTMVGSVSSTMSSATGGSGGASVGGGGGGGGAGGGGGGAG